VSGPGVLQARARLRLGAFLLDVDLEPVSPGVTAIFGPSGAGKSQLLAAIAGASRPDEGRIILRGAALFDSQAGVEVAMERRGIGWVFQDGRLFPHLGVEANLRYGARRAGGRDAGVRFDALVEALGIGHLLARRPENLSGGERQRVAIGRALLSQPALLLMDEPLAALDLHRRAEILPYLERLRALAPELAILYVTHALSEVVRLADRLVIMDGGTIAAQGALAEVLARTDLPVIAARADAAAALDLQVEGHDAARGLTRLLAGRAVLLAPRLALAPGARVRAAALARDVLLATEAPRGLSARNVLPATVQTLAPSGRADGVVLASVQLQGGPTILSALTSDAVAELRLHPGRQVYAIVKSVAVEGLSPGGLLQALESDAV
jgi:molybdate transport system ATP-binding protein